LPVKRNGVFINVNAAVVGIIIHVSEGVLRRGFWLWVVCVPTLRVAAATTLHTPTSMSHVRVERSSRSVVITNPYVFEFMSSKGDNDAFRKAVHDVVEGLCRSASDYTARHAEQQDASSVMSFLQGFERRQQDVYASMEHRWSSASQATMQLAAGQMATAMASLQETIATSVDRLSVDSLAASLNDSIKDWLEARMHSTQTNVQSSLGELESALRRQLAEVLTANERVAAQFTALPASIADKVHQEDGGIRRELAGLGREWSSSATRIVDKVKAVDDQLQSLVQTTLAQVTQDRLDNMQLTNDIKSVPLLAKDVMSETLKKLAEQSLKVSLTVEGTHQQLQGLQKEMRDKMETTLSRLEAFDRQSTSIHHKGWAGEARLLELLPDRLMSRDGYTVRDVSNLAHNCDIAVTRHGCPTIFVESKAHGQHTGAKVGQRDVDKFRSDLIGLNSHGIMVSLYSGIVGKGAIEVESLPQGKFAVYLSNNNYDVDIIADMVSLLYKFDSIVRSSSTDEADEDEGITYVTPAAMARVQRYLDDFGGKIADIKKNLKLSLSLLSEVALDSIANVLLSGEDGLGQPLAGRKCEWCGRVCRNSSGLSRHQTACPKKPVGGACGPFAAAAESQHG
jgi:hypothetical protein